jgi:hypothetical protein
MNLKNIFVSLALVLPFLGFAQIRPKKQPVIEEQPAPTGFKLYYIISDSGDTIPTVTLEPLTVSEARVFASKREERKWSRLKRDVAKVYPYSKLAGNKLKQYNEQLTGKSEKDQKRILKLAENDIKAEFEDDIRNMTLNQGRILIKLIDRETGNTSYGLVKDLRGSFQAVFWQSVARIFRTNLKSAYDPNANSEDRMIEDIIISIEDGTFVN